ncbi:MAG: hypothetical protein KDB03_06160 [Planctomycetales bacterium]|nr:hypothetical protein [Planctomycetales bacterium]
MYSPNKMMSHPNEDHSSDSSNSAQVLRDPMWVAFELHDGLLQWLHGAKMQLEAFIAGKPETGGTKSENSITISRVENVKLALEYVAFAIDEGRGLIDYLEHSHAPRSRLELLIDTFIARANRRSIIPVRFALVGEIPTLDARIEWNVLRITQQAVTNSLEHARANWVQVQVGPYEDDELEICILDDGVGFDPNAPSVESDRTHWGLASMQHRAKVCGAQLQINSSPGNGTQIKLQVPVSK